MVTIISVLFLIWLVLPVVALVRSVQASRQIDQLKTILSLLRTRIDQIETGHQAVDRSDGAQAEGTAAPEPPARVPAETVTALREKPPSTEPEPVLPMPAETAGTADAIQPEPSLEMPFQSPPSRETGARPLSPPFAAKSQSGFDWESFTGAQLFAWLGGFALFLSFVFLVKFSVDMGFLGPAVRVALGTIAGTGCVIAGLLTKRRRYRVTAQTLCASGVAILHVVTFAAYQFYGFLEAASAFPLLALITAAAFVLSVRLDSRYIALLGLLGGFLNPYLVSSGQDRPFALFGYLAVLDIGLIFIALRKNWAFLVPLSALGTTVLQGGWLVSFFRPEDPLTAMMVLAAFAILYLCASLYSTRARSASHLLDATCGSMANIALAFGFVLLLRDHTGLLFSFILVLNLVLAGMAMAVSRGWIWHSLGGGLTFLLLFGWTIEHLDQDNLMGGMAAYFGFAALHAGLPILIHRWQGISNRNWTVLGNLYPALMLIPLLAASTRGSLYSSGTLWLAVWLVNVVGLAATLVSGLFGFATIFLVITFLIAGSGLLRLEDASSLLDVLPVLLISAVGFVLVGLFFERVRGDSKQEDAGSGLVRLPVLAAWLPYLLLLTIFTRLPMEGPSLVFGMGILLSGILLMLDHWAKAGPLSLVAMGSSVLLQASWLTTSFNPSSPSSTIFWILAFAGLFVAYPFLFPKAMPGRRFPSWTSALAGPLHFGLLAVVVGRSFELELPGLLPGLFALLYGLLVWIITRGNPSEGAGRQFRVALFGGVTLFFVSLIFPFQFDREWLTMGWALEGVALIALFHRVPHSGLKKWGFGLLVIAFIRLILNPNLLINPSTESSLLLNGFLYTFGLGTACHLLAARLWKPRQEELFKVPVRGLLNSLAAVLAFLLVNIEIANFYSVGPHLRFEFGRSLGQDLTYSLAWGGFGLMLLIVGLIQNSRAARLASLTLISTTTLKLFFYDLWSLSQLYRVGALLGLAVILVLVSILYQRIVRPPSET